MNMLLVLGKQAFHTFLNAGGNSNEKRVMSAKQMSKSKKMYKIV